MTVDDDQKAYSVPRGCIVYGGYKLTHLEFVRYFQNVPVRTFETGIHYPDGDVQIIEHDTCQFNLVERVFGNAVKKGWSIKRMKRVLNYLITRQTRPELP